MILMVVFITWNIVLVLCYERIANYDFVEEREGCKRTSGGISNDELYCVIGQFLGVNIFLNKNDALMVMVSVKSKNLKK